jgi:endo-1,4-beta-D-glucanase Y
MNMAVDYAWFSRDRDMRSQIEKYHEFFSTRLTDNNVENQLFALDGSNPDGGGSTALTATLAAGSLASQHSLRARFVENLWNVGQQQGQYRYYQEGVYLLGLLNTAGKFRYTFE